jgi:hypothetical protein
MKTKAQPASRFTVVDAAFAASIECTKSLLYDAKKARADGSHLELTATQAGSILDRLEAVADDLSRIVLGQPLGREADRTGCEEDA